MFRRVLIANRGEIARRIIKTLTAMGIESVVIYSEADRDAIYIKEASDAICIGPAPAKQSYLCQKAILRAARETECEAIHPGFGFLSENAIFATRCLQQKLTFIGPKPSHMALMGDKARAIETMKQVGLPTLPGSEGVIKSFSQAEKLAQSLGYPVLLKARAGGGGKGMRLVEHETSLKELFEQAQQEAQSAFGDQELYLEKFIKNARHIEFQVLADNHENVVVLGERECSIQRKNQKLIEESPACGFKAAQRNHMSTVIIEALKKIGYLNAGTLEFLLADDGKLYFMEMNTRIQVEHPVTELLYGVDLIEWQIRIAAGERLTLKQDELIPQGASIECRINAENPLDNFRPSPGKITDCYLPEQNLKGPVRIDTHISEGFSVSPYYDSMLAKVIVHGADRNDALKLMEKTLSMLTIKGVHTTIDFHKAIIAHPDFARGTYNCSFIESHKEYLFRHHQQGHSHGKISA